jgi:UPF0716 protein FxsA
MHNWRNGRWLLYIDADREVQGQRTPFPTMTRLLPLLILGGLAAELASIILVGNLLGVLPTLLLLFAGGVLGISLIRSAGSGIAEAVRSPVQASSVQRGAAGKAVARVVSGLLFLIPGFFSDIIGLLLLLPPVRQWLRARIPVERFSTGSPPGRRSETIIDVEAIEIEGELQPPTQPLGPDRGGPTRR